MTRAKDKPVADHQKSAAGAERPAETVADVSAADAAGSAVGSSLPQGSDIVHVEEVPNFSSSHDGINAGTVSEAGTLPPLPLVLGHVLAKGGKIALRAGDIVVTCSEPGFCRAGIRHPHLRVHHEGALTEEQLKLLRNEPKISVIEIGG